MEQKTLKATLLENKIVVAKGWEELEQRSFGKQAGSRLELSLVEALYLTEKGRISVSKAGKKLGFNVFMEFAIKKDRRIHEKFVVYADLRDRGLVAKTGFKFGCDFRVYQRGVSVKRGPKEASEHTKWIVFSVPEDYRCSFTELSRAVRLAHSIRARMLWAIVDNEDNVTYYSITRLKP